MIPLTLLPMWWRIGAAVALVAALAGAHLYRVHAAFGKGHAAAVSERAAADGAAIMARAKENATLAAKQDDTNRSITKAKNDEIANLRARLAAERMRRPAFCDGLAGTPEAESAGSGNGTDTRGGILPARVDEDIRALILKTEETAATARACQSWVRENGFAD